MPRQRRGPAGVRRALTLITVPVTAASLAAAPAFAAAPAGVARTGGPPGAGARAAASPGASPAASPSAQTVGGPRLASRGVVAGTAPGVPAPPKIKAGSYMIADADTGQVLAAKDPHGHYLPASTLKTLTALALVPRLEPNRLVRPSQKACDTEGTKVGLTPKMQYKVSDLFHALLMMSANDAAVTLAEADGGMRRTLADMNAEARRINARDTLAGSPNGLDKDLGLDVRTQHTSAYDLALILREGMKNPQYRAYMQAIDFQFPAPPTKKERKKGKKVGGYPIHTHNHMLPGERLAYPGMLGGKNGYTIAAQQTFVAQARRGGHTIVISLMRADMPPSAYAAKLLNWGFAARGKVQPVGTLVPPGDIEQTRENGGSGVLPDAPLASDDASRMWLLVGGGTVGALLAIAVLFVVLRRRRRLEAVRPRGDR
ncbi:D-alanyl-D-alanine carboxypeptidase family protein [Actinomadura mexicana]|uniref:D-alanyl-D-alanine carboxypeptidase (Penicillin-binding protein 5/6) n=1 Tax=Actinomadura mexicana TaxID=134959 RepID=A0A239C976_9ACTN|nr:D-alanyl-D-alanine carboxypeptidase [Actinomadura mexicana]SNS16442.1 D-alanyl-D-alanine carboxypeptidase (penicillin-binding protein 5/6) [Actinomadura mexicana]